MAMRSPWPLEGLSVACRVRSGPVDLYRELFLSASRASKRQAGDADTVLRLVLDRWPDQAPPTQSEGGEGVGGAVDATRAASEGLRLEAPSPGASSGAVTVPCRVGVERARAAWRVVHNDFLTSQLASSGRRTSFVGPRDDDLRRVRTYSTRGRIQRGTASPQAEHQEMRRMRRGWQSAAADEEGLREVGGGRVTHLTDDQSLAMIQKRVAVGDPMAIYTIGRAYDDGRYGLEKDVTRAIELYERAAELGIKDAHYCLGCTYDEGTDVERDAAKAIQHYEAAAMCGYVDARHNLGCEEADTGNHDLALQHFLIAAKMGREDSLNKVRCAFMLGIATKDDYAEALRGYQSAIEEMKSREREQVVALQQFASWLGQKP
ncbi:hypothetical protein THAOC_32582, partial [Thalassiosira oceanica]